MKGVAEHGLSSGESVLDLKGKRPQLSSMQRRINFAVEHPDYSWIEFAENVPKHELKFEPKPAIDWVADTQVYADSKGLMEFRTAISGRLCGDPLRAIDNILVTAGGMHGIGLVARELYSVGVRRAWCQLPLFRSVYDSLQAVGMEVVGLSVSPGDLISYLGILGPTDVLYVNSPQNPTGDVLSDDSVQALGALSENTGCAVLFDSVYDDFTVSPAERGSFAITQLALTGERIFKIGSMSKNHGLPGLRMGWVVSYPLQIRELATRLEWESVAMGTAAQRFAAGLVSSGDRELQETVRVGREFVRHRIGLLSASGWPCSISGDAAGGTQLWINAGMSDTEQFAEYAFSEHSLLLTSHANYVGAGTNCLRLPVGLPLEELSVGLDRFEHAIRAYWAIA